MRRASSLRQGTSIVADLGFGALAIVSIIAVLAVVGTAIPFVMSYFSKSAQINELEEQKTTMELLEAQRVQGLNRHYEANIRKLRERADLEKQSLEAENLHLKTQLENLQKNADDVEKQKTLIEEQAQSAESQKTQLQENLDLAMALNQKHMFELTYDAQKGLDFDDLAFKAKVSQQLKALEKKGLKQFRIYSYSANLDDAAARSQALKQAIDTREFLTQQGVHENFIEMRIVGNKPAYNASGKSIDRVDIRGLH